jgi:hypothetical protein
MFFSRIFRVPDVTGWGGDVTIVSRAASKSYFLSVGYDDRQARRKCGSGSFGKQSRYYLKRTEQGNDLAAVM